MLTSRKKTCHLLAVTLPIIFLVAFCIPSFSCAEVKDPKVILKAGTVVALRLTETVNSRTKSIGDTVMFEVSREVKANGYTVIDAGTRAAGEVVKSKSANFAGIPGEIQIAISRTEAIDGTPVMLRGTLAREGEDKYLLAIGGGILCLLPFLLKGEEGVIPVGAEVKAYVDYNTEVVVAE